MNSAVALSIIAGVLIPVVGIIYLARGQSREQAQRLTSEREELRRAAYQDGYRDGKNEARADYLERQLNDRNRGKADE